MTSCLRAYSTATRVLMLVLLAACGIPTTASLPMPIVTSPPSTPNTRHRQAHTIPAVSDCRTDYAFHASAGDTTAGLC